MAVPSQIWNLSPAPVPPIDQPVGRLGRGERPQDVLSHVHIDSVAQAEALRHAARRGGRTGRPLRFDRLGKRGQFGVSARGLRQRHADQWQHAFGDRPPQLGVAGQALPRGRRVQHGAHRRSIHHRNRLVVAGQRDVVDRLEQHRLLADDVVHRLHADAGVLGDGGESGPRKPSVTNAVRAASMMRDRVSAACSVRSALE
jgi:hypothetical protein